MLLPVTAALIRREGRILVCLRRRDAHMGGLWELPGGKLEAGEGPRACLARELSEELGVEASVGAVHDVVFHRYPEFDLLLLVYQASILRGEPRPLGCDEVRWVTGEELRDLDFPPADSELVDALAEELVP